MPLFRFVLALVVALASVQGSGLAPAFAQDNASAAKAHYSRATRLYEVGEYRQALEEFKTAHVTKPDPAFLFNIAQCHRQLGELEQARVMYKRFLGMSPKAPNRSEVEKRIAGIEDELAEKRNKAAENKPVGLSPSSDVAADGTENPQLVPNYQPHPEAPGVAIGTHAVPPQPAAAGSSLRYLRWIGAGVTLALVGSAIATGVSASSKFENLNGSCARTLEGCSTADINQVKSRATLTNVLWGAAGAAAIATGILFYLTPQGATVQVAWRY